MEGYSIRIACVYKHVQQELLHHSRGRELPSHTEQVPGAVMEQSLKKTVKTSENIQFPYGNNLINVLLTVGLYWY